MVKNDQAPVKNAAGAESHGEEKGYWKRLGAEKCLGSKSYGGLR